MVAMFLMPHNKGFWSKFNAISVVLGYMLVTYYAQ